MPAEAPTPTRRGRPVTVVEEPVGLRLPPDILEELKQHAREEDRPLASLCRRLVMQAWDQQKRSVQTQDGPGVS